MHLFQGFKVNKPEFMKDKCFSSTVKKRQKRNDSDDDEDWTPDKERIFRPRRM